MHRLYTAICDENDLFRATLSQLQARDPLIHAAVRDFTTRRQQVNNNLLAKLDTLTSSSDYTGDCSRGVRVGGTASSGGDVGSSGSVLDVDGRAAGKAGEDSDDDNEGDLGGDETDELVGQLVDYVSDLVLLP